jgi:aminoglycoside 6'-N-acetyltransferase
MGGLGESGEPRRLPVLRGPRVTLRPGRPGDEAAIQAVFDSPEVARWWPSDGEGHVRAKLENRDPDVEIWLIEVNGRVVGLIQAYEETDPQYRHAGIDLSLHPDVHGQGIGPEAIRVLARHLFARGHHRIVIDPNAANARAIRAYEKVGFRRVGIMRRYEWDAYLGAWTDGLMLDLVPEDLTTQADEEG